MNNWFVHKPVKFATQIDGAVLEELRHTARELNQNISTLVEDAIVQHLRRVRVRPAFRSAMNEVLKENRELLERLAK